MALFVLSAAEEEFGPLTDIGWRAFGNKVVFEARRQGGAKVYYDRPVIQAPT